MSNNSKPIFTNRINLHFLLVSISIATAISFRLRDLNRDILSQDEATTWYYFISPPLKSFSFMSYIMPNNHIFHSILANLSIQLFGNSEIGLRLPVFFAGVLAVGFIYWWALLLCKSKEIAFLSSLFFALSPIHIAYSQTARGYSLIILFSILSQLSLYKLLENYKIRWIIVFITSNILTVFTMPSNLIFVVSQYISIIIIYLMDRSNTYKFDSESKHFLRKISVKKIIFSFLIITLPAILLYFPILDQLQIQAEKEGTFLLKDIIPLLIKDYLLLGLPQGMFLFFLYGCWRLFVKNKFWGSFLFLLFILPFFSAVTGVSGPSRVYLFCLPFFILAFVIGFYEIVIFILKVFFVKIKSSSKVRKIATISASLIFSIPLIIFLEKNYYSQYHSFKYKELRDYIRKLDHINNLIFKPGSLNFNYYLDNSISRNALGILHSNNIKNIYLIRRLKVKSNDFSLESYVYSFRRDSYKLLDEFKDMQLNTEFDTEIIRMESPDSFKLYRLQPSSVIKLINKNLLKNKWKQIEGRQIVTTTYKPYLNQIEVNINQGMNSSSEDFSLIYSESVLRLKTEQKGLIFIIYALTYPGISPSWIFSPLSISVLIRDEKGKSLNILYPYAMNRNVSGFEFDGNRLWYIMQKIVPIEKGYYDLSLGLWVRGLEKGGMGKHKYLVKNLQAYFVEF